MSENLHIDTRIVLFSAAKYLRKADWCRGQALDEYGRVCLIGAVTFSLMQTNAPWADEFPVIRDKLAEVCGMCPVQWNDTVCKSKSEAVAMLEKAAGV